jgi:glucose-6-phosphate-specific signal transduction histidine kinase
LERWWWQLFWQLRRQYMPVEVMADIAVMVGMLSEDMPLATLRVDMLVSVLAVRAVTILREPRADTRGMQDAHIIGMAAVTGEAVTGIRPMDILDWAITVRAMAIHITGSAIPVTATAGTMVRTTVTILTSTDTGRP